MFIAQDLLHGQRVIWDRITHVRLKPGAKGDTLAGQRILDYLKRFADSDGVAEICKFQEEFPAVRTHTTKLRAMRAESQIECRTRSR
jgi:hypothetical protein